MPKPSAHAGAVSARCTTFPRRWLRRSSTRVQPSSKPRARRHCRLGLRLMAEEGRRRIFLTRRQWVSGSGGDARAYAASGDTEPAPQVKVTRSFQSVNLTCRCPDLASVRHRDRDWQAVQLRGQAWLLPARPSMSKTSGYASAMVVAAVFVTPALAQTPVLERRPLLAGAACPVAPRAQSSGSSR